MNIWDFLQIQPTKDVASIKKAYARMAKEYNPEDHPQEFLQLRAAYEQALAYAEPGETHSRTPYATSETPAVAENREPGFSFSMDVDDSEDFKNCAAMVSFRQLYFEKKCKDRNVWINYFVSPEFLNVAYEGGFANALYRELAAEAVIEKSFLTMLCLAYGLVNIPGKDNGAAQIQFDGMGDIAAIAQNGKPPQRLNATELAIAHGFQDYAALRQLIKGGQWNDHISFQFDRLTDRYVSAYIHDKIPQNANLQAELFIPRHISSLKLLHHFFEVSTELPQQAYEIIWYKFDLKSATMGRNKVFYGKLRDIAQERFPNVGVEPEEKFQEFREDCQRFFQEIQETEDQEKITDFLAREDFCAALHDQDFVESDVLRHWISESANGCFLAKLIAFCEAEDGVIHRNHICDLAFQELNRRRIQEALKADRGTTDWPYELKVENRAFFRYLLNVAFHHAYSSEYSLYLANYLDYHFPAAFTWHEKLAGLSEDDSRPDNPASFTINLGGTRLDIIFHVRHIEYQYEGRPVYAPFISYKTLDGMTDDTLFWLLLPVVFAHAGNKEQVVSHLTERLSRLAFLDGMNLSLLADGVAGYICKQFEDQYFPECLRLRRELRTTLFCCDIYPGEGTLLLYKSELGAGEVLLREEALSMKSLDADIATANRLLDECTAPTGITSLKLKQLPAAMTAQLLQAAPKHWTKGDVTHDTIKEVFEMLAEGKLTRLMLEWSYGDFGPSRYLVVNSQRSDSGDAGTSYGCFCFDDKHAVWHGLVSMPELYRTVDHGAIEYMPFAYGKLPNYNIHRNCQLILSNLNYILTEVSDLRQQLPDNWDIWSYRSTPDYHVHKCLLGGFPPTDVFTNLFSRFTINPFPESLQSTSLEGETKEILINGATRPSVQEQLLFFFRQRLARLQLTWTLPGKENGAKKDAGAQAGLQAGQQNGTQNKPQASAQPYQAHILLRNDNGRFMMLYLNDEQKSVHFLVGDVSACQKATGRTYETAEFCGLIQPACLVHEDLKRIRAFLEILLPSIKEPDNILGMTGEFQRGFHFPEKADYEDGKEMFLRDIAKGC